MLQLAEAVAAAVIKGFLCSVNGLAFAGSSGSSTCKLKDRVSYVSRPADSIQVFLLPALSLS